MATSNADGAAKVETNVDVCYPFIYRKRILLAKHMLRLVQIQMPSWDASPRTIQNF